jgi:hypothetical protein
MEDEIRLKLLVMEVEDEIRLKLLVMEVFGDECGG